MDFISYDEHPFEAVDDYERSADLYNENSDFDPDEPIEDDFDDEDIDDEDDDEIDDYDDEVEDFDE